MVNTFTASLLTLFLLLIATSVLGQTPTPATAKPIAPGLIKLTGEDEKRAKELDDQIKKALKGDHWDEAITKAQELLALRTRAQGEKHFETVDAEWRVKTLRLLSSAPLEDRVAYQSSFTLSEQASALRAQGKYAAARPKFDEALNIRRRLLTDDHPTTAASYNHVAAILEDLGTYAEAQPLYEKAFSIRRRLLTEDHPDTAESYDDLGGILYSQGKYAAAQALREKALAIYVRLFTDEHPDTAICYNNLAATLNAQGNCAAAQPLYEKALGIRRRLFSDDHRSTATSYNNLAYNLYSQGKYAAAQPLYEKGLEISRRLLSDDHPSTAMSYNNVAMNLSAQEKYAEAAPLLEKALEIRRKLLTDNHPDTAASYGSVALNRSAQGKHAEAEPLYEKALEINRRLLSDDHPRTAASYNNLASNLNDRGKFAEAQPLFEKALAIKRRLLTDDHPDTALSYNNLAYNLTRQGKHAEAQPFVEQGLAIRRRVQGEDHPDTAQAISNLAYNSHAQGKYREARDLWISAVKGEDAARLQMVFTGLERARAQESWRSALAAVLSRLGQPDEAWQTLEQDLGRGLLDELVARQDRQIAPGDRDRLRELVAALERLDRLVETTPSGLDRAERARRFDDLKHQRELASIALGEFRARLAEVHGPLAGTAASLEDIQAALPPNAALIAWIDIHSTGPNAADRDGEHWGVVVRARGNPIWVPMNGTGPDGLWTDDDTSLPNLVRSELRKRPDTGTAETRHRLDKLRAQRMMPLASALGSAAGGLPPAERLIFLPSRAMAGIPIEVLLLPDDPRTVSYAPSATVFRYLREQPRLDRNHGMLALGDPVYAHSDRSDDPEPLPKNGLLLNVVSRGSNAASHGLKDGDVLVAYNGLTVNKRDDLKLVTDGAKPIPVEVWRAGASLRRDLAPGKLGAIIDSRPAPEAIFEERKLKQMLAATRAGNADFAPLPGTRREVEAIVQIFKSDGRPTRALLGSAASEPELERLAAANELKQFAFIHLATHGVVDEAIPQRSAVILTQAGLPDPLEQVLCQKPVFDGRLTVREIRRTWDLKAELVTMSACETALGREAGGEGFVGFTQALLMSGARRVCLSLWKVDDTATALLMTRFYQNMLGKRPGLSKPMPKAEALGEAKKWLRGLTSDEAGAAETKLSQASRGDVRRRVDTHVSTHPYEHPHFWAAFVLVGDPD
jgi:tetratricopeptide (TPR) repeat protein